MSVNIAFHNVDNSSVLDGFINKKSLKLSKFLDEKANIDWVIEKDSHNFIPKINIKSHNKNFSISAKSPNAFDAVKIAFDKAKRVISDDHDKRIMH